MRRLLLLGGATLALSSIASAPAMAAGAKLVEAKGPKFPQRTWVLSLPKPRQLQPGDVEVRENGKLVDGLTLTASNRAGSGAFGVVLAIDASESMHGQAIVSAMEAARAFAASRPRDQQLGLLFFSRDRSIGLPMTTDAARIEAALATVPALTKGTRIYDAGIEAVRMLEDARVRAGSVVILSDGADVGSQASAAMLASAARRAGARIFTVGLRSRSYDRSTLVGVASSGRGAYAEAGSTGRLKGVFERLGQSLAAEYLLTYRSLARSGTSVTVEARIADLAVPAIASYSAPSLHLPPGIPPKKPGAWSGAAALWGTIGAIALLLGIGAFLLVRSRRRSVSERIAAYVLPEGPDPDEALRRDLASPSGVLERFMERMSWWERFALRVELSTVPLTAAQAAGLTVVGTTALVWFFLAVGRPVSAGILALTPIAVHFFLKSRAERRRGLFADQLVENLQVVASAMRAGHSFEGGLAVASDEAAEPMKSELRRIVNDERLGVPIDEAMDHVAQRMASKELEQVSVVVALQRKSGGNIAELLDRAVEGMRHQADLRRMIQTLTAQGRAGGAIVTTMPFVMALVLSLMSPGYFDPMLESSAGIALFVGAGILVGLGWLVIRKIVDIKV